MTKKNEMSDPASCLSKAADDEPLFVLRAHDASAPLAIRAWMRDRVMRGKNGNQDPEIREAYETCKRMHEWRGHTPNANGVCVECGALIQGSVVTGH